MACIHTVRRHALDQGEGRPDKEAPTRQCERTHGLPHNVWPKLVLVCPGIEVESAVPVWKIQRPSSGSGGAAGTWRGTRRRSGARNAKPHSAQRYFLRRVKRIRIRSIPAARLIFNFSDLHFGHMIMTSGARRLGESNGFVAEALVLCVATQFQGQRVPRPAKTRKRPECRWRPPEGGERRSNAGLWTW